MRPPRPARGPGHRADAAATGGHTSGDLFLRFATGNRWLPRTRTGRIRRCRDVRALVDCAIDALFDATIEATEEAILNALVAAETMTGRDGITAPALPHDRLLETMAEIRPAGGAGDRGLGVMGGTGRSIREATEDDLPAIRAILAAHGNDGAIVIADVVGPYLRHLIAHGRARVAIEDGAVVGFGATVDAGGSGHLADLFVRADRLGQGIGRPLLDAVFGDAERRTTFASDDPRALPIYVRAGMRPFWASLYVEGPSSRRPRRRRPA